MIPQKIFDTVYYSSIIMIVIVGLIIAIKILISIFKENDEDKER